MSYQQTIIDVKKSPPDTPHDWTEERLAALRTVRALPCGSRALWSIAKRTHGLFALPHKAENWAEWHLTDHQIERLKWSHQEPIDEITASMERQGIRMCLSGEADYPNILKHIPDPPYALFIRGAPITDEIRLAVVGTRSLTAYGKRTASFFGSELGQAGLAVVSGLAAGIDAETHRACVSAGGRAIAVLPGGIDDVSIVPRTNTSLARDMLENEGTLISEHAPGTEIQPYSFLYRNRLIAGLARAVLIVEGDLDSGALVTARLALEQGKDVLAVPGPIWSRASRGPNRLIADGARLCESLRDIWNVLGMESKNIKRTTEARHMLPVTPAEEMILSLCSEERTADELARTSGYSAQEVASALSLLELKGHILNVGPKTFLRLP